MSCFCSQILSKVSPAQRLLARWAAWFFFSNALLWMLISLNYIYVLPHFGSIAFLGFKGSLLAITFLISSFVGYFSLVAYAGWVLVALISRFSRKKTVFVLSLSLATGLSIFLVVDSIAYHLFHFHLLGVVWPIFSAGVAQDVLALSWVEYLWAAGVFVFVCVLEVSLAFMAWKWVQHKERYVSMGFIGSLLAACFFLSYTLCLRASSVVSLKPDIMIPAHLITMEAQLIPFYDYLLGATLLEKDGFTQLQMRGEGVFMQLQQVSKPLRYPLHPLQCSKSQKPYNIVWIVVDALRFDALNPKVMPNTAKFSEHAWQFEDHYSGGNATGPGIFSLFYSIPYNYWTAMLTQRQGPVFIQEFQKQGYEFGIYRSASMEYPALHQTVFRDVKSLQLNTEGKKAYQRDAKITEQFSEFLQKRDVKKPFFGFLFYDGVHNYCQKPVSYRQPFQPAISVCNRAYLNEDSDPVPYALRYMNAAHYVDGLIARVLNDLKQKSLLSNTIVMITADHGEEFNDSQQNYWGHVSAYTPWQLKVPLVLYWPGQKPKKIRYLTSHYDVVPFFMQKVLACKNPLRDYSVGQSLLQPGNRSYLIANSYMDYAVLNQDYITRIYPQGNYLVSDRFAKPLPEVEFDTENLRAVFKDLNRYFQ